MLDDGVDALYGARPQGTFADAQRLGGNTAESSALAGVPAAAASAPSALAGESEDPVAAATYASTVLTGKPKRTAKEAADLEKRLAAGWAIRHKEIYAEELAAQLSATPDPVTSVPS